MNLLFTSFAVFAIYPDITRIKGVNGNEFSPGTFHFHHYVNLNEDKPNFGIFRKWDEREQGLSIRGIRPIVVHALNEWKRASLIQGRIDFPNSQFYWGPHGLVKRSVENESQDFHEKDNEDADVQNIPRYSEANGYSGEYGEHTFEVVPTIILNDDDYPSPYKTHGTFYIPCDYKTHESYDRFGTVKGNLQNWKNNPKYVESKAEIYRNSEPRDPTLHSHGHSHFHQHVHSHGLNVLGPQTQFHGGAGFVHNTGLVTNVPIPSAISQTGLVTNVPIPSAIPQTHITNINIPQQHSTGFTSHLNGGFTSGLNHGLSGFSSHQTAVNIGHGGVGGFGTTTGGNVQIAQVSGANNAVSQSSFREAGEEPLGNPSLFQFPLNSRRVSFDRSTSQEGQNQRSFQREKRSLFPLELVPKILKTVADDSLKLSDRTKRSLPLVKLAVDPNAKLDVFQTSDNMGNLIKSSLNDETSPVSHLKDMTGSLRDTFISSTRLIPSDIIVPARYKVVDTHQHDIVKIPLSRSSENKYSDNSFVGGINPAVYQQPAVFSTKSGAVGKENQKVSNIKNATLKKSKKDPEKLSSSDPTSFYKTYQKIGDMIRNTVVSSQQTLSHVNDAISSGRKLAHTTKGAVPRLLVPLSKVPALEKPGSKPYIPVQSDRVLLVAPKGSGVDDIVGNPRKHNEDFVSTSNLFDSVGLTHSTEEDGNMMEHLLQRSPQQLQNKHLLLTNNKERYVDGALEVLNEAEETVDATNLHDFIIKLRNELERPHVVGEKNIIGAEPLSKPCVCSKRRSKGKTDDEQLKMEGNEKNMKNKIYQNSEEIPEDSIVESSFFTNKDLLKPFMGRITLEDLHKILNISRHSDKENEIKSSLSPKREINREFINNRIKRGTEDDNEPMLGAINPNLFEEYFNEPLQEIKDHHRDPFREPADQVSQHSKQYSNNIEVKKKPKKFLLKPIVTNSKSTDEVKKILEKIGYDDKKNVTNDGRKEVLPKIYEIVSLSS